MARLTSTYGVLEKNAVVYPRTGNIMALYALDESLTRVENGMLLGIDYAGQKIVKPADGDIVAIVDCAEKEYYEETGDRVGLNKYSVLNDEFKPRMGILSINDRFTTTTVDLGTYADAAAAITAGAVGVPGTDGVITLKATAESTDKVVLKAIEANVMANGETGIKFAVIKAN